MCKNALAAGHKLVNNEGCVLEGDVTLRKGLEEDLQEKREYV